VARAFEPGDLRGCRLLFCCTPDADLNAFAARQAKALGAWVCQAAEPSQGDLRVPAVIDAAGLMLTLSTGGASPALAKALRLRLEAWLKASDLGFVLEQLEQRRAALKADPAAKARLLGALCAPEALELMLAERSPARRKRLEKLLRS
jgi:siroheme synthase-like protein